MPRGITLFLRLLLLAALAVGLTPVAGAVALPRDSQPPVILVLPPEWSADSDDLLLRARVTDASRVGDVMLWIRGEYDKEFQGVPMRPGGIEGYRARLPVWPGQGDQVTYYIEATDRLGNGPRRSGSPASPFVARHEVVPVPRIKSTGMSYPIALGVFLPPLIFLWIVHREELRQRERVFWFGILANLLDKRGGDLARGIDELCARTHRHPRHGKGRLSKPEARRWLEQLRQHALRPVQGASARTRRGAFWLPSID